MHNNVRIEKDSLGEIKVPSDKYWGAQTQRSLKNFPPNNEIMPKVLIQSLLIIKLAAAKANLELNLLNKEIAEAIIQAAEEALDGKFDDNFPLSVWQTGSGTQTNMNVNEVLSNRAIEILGGTLGTKHPVHPNDHVNLGQSSNDTFPTAMNIAALLSIKDKLVPSLNNLISLLKEKQEAYKDVIKIGRTHLQDAVPMTLGQEFSGYLTQMEASKDRMLLAMSELFSLAQGATAVGTGLNSSSEFVQLFIKEVSSFTNLSFKSAENKFYSIATHDDLVNFSGSLNSLAVALTKIINDIRFLACGPRAGINELILPENEPGSSIMPGKVNPTQIEALSMVCAQVMGAHHAVSLGGMQGHLELNAYKPLIIYNILNSIDILSTSIESFNNYCLKDIQPNLKTMEKLTNESLMLVTALTKHIGYDKAAEIAKLAHKKGTTLREEGVLLGYFDEKNFNEWVNPRKMI